MNLDMDPDVDIKSEGITIAFTPKGALMLKELVQNPSCPPEEEDPEVRKFREVLWNALKDYHE